MAFWFIFVFLTQAWSMPQTCQLDGNLIRTSHNLLKDAGGHFPLQCIKENVLIMFPSSAFESNGTIEQETGVKMAIYETLRSLSLVLEDGDLPTKWDEKIMDDFQNIVYRQVDSFSKCTMSSKPNDVDMNTDFSDRATALKSYFDKITSLLQEKSFSFCAWEIVRKELVRTLHFILDHRSDMLRWPRRL
ncbi:interferon alpha-7-like [Anguilla rostrata]|uniref:Uncharacterized protein n=1 Tax=Anguilla anguilla TaxID=7936 RepID=A0A0E9WSI4_ANGAN|nr:interferon alpha-7-like [Anguilla anguilla]